MSNVPIIGGGSGTGANRVAVEHDRTVVPQPTGSGYRLRLVTIPGGQMSGTLLLNWQRGNGTSWSGVCAFSSKINSNGGVDYTLNMLSGNFGFGSIQIVESGSQCYIELVSNGSWSYRDGSVWQIVVDYVSHSANQKPVLVTPPIQGSGGTVRLNVRDQYRSYQLYKPRAVFASMPDGQLNNSGSHFTVFSFNAGSAWIGNSMIAQGTIAIDSVGVLNDLEYWVRLSGAGIGVNRENKGNARSNLNGRLVVPVFLEGVPSSTGQIRLELRIESGATSSWRFMNSQANQSRLLLTTTV